uniref:Integrin subunit alpha E n=1 Tax=Erpetoichthys calabaricus TaxID=27687 RepID=A0A8C4STD0_ERPCA
MAFPYILMFLPTLYPVDGFNIDTKVFKTYSLSGNQSGQTVLQYKNGVLIASPMNNNAHEVIWQCQINQQKCAPLALEEDEKGSSVEPILSASKNGKAEQFFVCQQHKRRKKINENINGICTILRDDFKKKQKVVPEPLVVELQNKNTNNNNNKDIAGASGFISDKVDEIEIRGNINNNNNNNNNKENKPKDDDDDDEDWTEIAFVMDGSGSIEKEDFQKAKDFIKNMMSKIWENCFLCNFAVVQYGAEIVTELSLKDNKNASFCLIKVQDIVQLGKVTKTASAIQLVLNDTFTEEKGSKPNSKKFIIVLTDGEIFEDPLKLEDVMNSPLMVNITRFAIGVGADFNKSKGKTELQQIASDPNDKHLFTVDNYGALDGLLHSLEKSITGIEGTQDVAAFQFELSEAGFSTHLTEDGTLLFGAVGAYDWSGGLILKKMNDVKFLNDSSSSAGKYSYLGYAVAAVKTRKGYLYGSGAPRHDLKGRVVIFSEQNNNMTQILSGQQAGSYFGSKLCPLDIDGDSFTDYLLVGAPFFHIHGEEGKVYVYKLQDENLFEKVMELQGSSGFAFARFGFAIANVGDIDGNNFNDIAIGAPLESSNAGCVYIYNGYKHGLRQHYSQKIEAAKIDRGLQYFGQSIDGGTDLTGDNQDDITVGSLGTVVVLRSLPVFRITPENKCSGITIRKEMQNDKTPSELKICPCFVNTINWRLMDEDSLVIDYTVELDTEKEQKRVIIREGKPRTRTFTITKDTECTEELFLHFVSCHDDCFSDVMIKFNFSLHDKENVSRGILDSFTDQEVFFKIPFKKDCGDDHVCTPEIDLTPAQSKSFEIIIGEMKELTANFSLINRGEDSYMTTMNLSYPNILTFKSLSESQEVKEFICDSPEIHPLQTGTSRLCLKIGYPVYKTDSKIYFQITWQVTNTKSNENYSLMNVSVGCKNNGSQLLKKVSYAIHTKHSVKMFLKGRTIPAFLALSEDARGKHPVKFLFEVKGENFFGAEFNLAINVTSVEDIKATITQNASEIQNCLVEHYITTCRFVASEANITVDTIVNFEKELHNTTAVAILSYNEDLYLDNGGSYQVEVPLVVDILKENSYLPAMIGSSVAGFVILAVLIFILFKIGFFKRKYKEKTMTDQQQEETKKEDL